MKINARILALVVAGAFGLAALPGDIAISPAQACCQSFSPAPAPVYRAPSPSAPLARPPAIVARPPVHRLTVYTRTPASNLPPRLFTPPPPGDDAGDRPGPSGPGTGLARAFFDMFPHLDPIQDAGRVTIYPGPSISEEVAEDFVEIEQEDDFRLGPDPATNGSIALDLQRIVVIN